MPQAVAWHDRYAISPDEEAALAAPRYSGLVVCAVCGRQLYDHPPYPAEPCLTITCEGALVKL